MDLTNDIELQLFKTNGNDGASNLSHEQGTAEDDVDGAPYRIPNATERDMLLNVQTSSCNGEMVVHAAEAQSNLGNAYTPQKNSCVDRIKRELNEVVYQKVKVWMVIIFIFVLILAVIIISLVLCSVIHEDEDENFDSSLFKVPRSFNGSFQLPNLVFTEKLSTRSSDESQTLAAHLQEKLAGLYRSSPALGRYFSEAEISAFRNGSVIADYQLTFVMPEEQQDQLRNVTLSREMVYNVFRQFLYDQEQPDESGQMTLDDYIDPISLNMCLRH
ncbi:TPA-induced transmembrane protein homolog isoform X2 [Sander lucioperca]|uniref:TPA-induced transmembrane protein homolog isoform X2 n=1 Tax=Sander lucioperca TaxID=283035 RepID=UPI00125D1D81|nr:TPA-induced transmembrane protein homolog isoform X2 [Sander lucioperca]